MPTLKRVTEDVLAPAETKQPHPRATATHRALTTLTSPYAREVFLRERLRLAHPSPTPIRLWIYLGLVTAFAALVRLWGLAHPHSLVFDETYYVKDAFSLSEQGYAGVWNEEPNEAFETGDTSDLQTKPSFVVHPDVGKWLIAIGIRIFGVDSSAGWRIAVAIAGIISVWLLGRIAARLFRSTTVAVTAAALLAMDGIHIVETRVALLDAFVMLFALFGFWALLRDRDQSRTRLAREVAEDPDALNDPWGPRIWARPWLLAAGVFLGLACGVKWSGLYALAAVGLTAVAWDLAARRAVGARLWVGAGIFRGGIPAFVNLVPVAAATYLASWFSWFTHPGAYYRTWAQDLRAAGDAVPRSWLPDALNNLLEYHLATYRFHVGLDSPHDYQSNPFGWLLQLRPTSFFWETSPGANCGNPGGECAEAITALGNPAIWWPAALGLLLVIWGAARHRDWRAWAILTGYLGLYVPWLAYPHRTIFTFYTIAFVPFVCLAWVYALGRLTGHVRALPPVPYATADGAVVIPEPPQPHTISAGGRIAWTAALAAVFIVFVFFLPIWTGMEVPKWFWRSHMWLGNLWI